MKFKHSAGLTLVELLVAMAIASLVGATILQLVIGFQRRILTEISRNDLQDRAERLIRFVANDIREAAFMLGAVPLVAGDVPLALVHDSLSEDPLEILPHALIPEDGGLDDDTLTFVKAISFAPPLRLAQAGVAGEPSLELNRRPNLSPGSTRELRAAPEAINHLVLGNHRRCYALTSADQTLHLEQALLVAAPVGTEVLGVRAYRYFLDPFAGSYRLRRDDLTSWDILDDVVDGLQFEYLLADGSMVDQPANPAEIRAVRISLLVKDLRSDQAYPAADTYQLGNRSYGPYRDHFRRVVVSQLVEVKNHGLP